MRDEELTAAIDAVRERVRARYPETVAGINTPDLLPLLHARDMAEAKVAAIGTVNPRPPGFKNNLIQKFKKTVARALNWHVREQVEFNRAVMACVQATLETLTETNRALSAVAALAANHRSQEFEDLRAHWHQWRTSFEERRSASEIHLLRSLSELQSAFQLRVTLLEQSFRDLLGRHEASFRSLSEKHHDDFQLELDRRTDEIQKRLWDDLANIQVEYERTIHRELKAVRQRAAAQPGGFHPQEGPRSRDAAQASIAIDWLRFADQFRGSEERIRSEQHRYTRRFQGARSVLDIGCGRGEFLEAARDAGIPARGIDSSAECVALCRGKNLEAEQADLFLYLNAQPDASLAGVYCSQVVEHLEPARLPDFINLLGRKAEPGALVAMETPNPECLAIFATHFYIDPTHTRPVPPVLLRFYLEEAGFGQVEIERLSPAVESIPALAEIPQNLRETLFGGLDYAIFARKL